VTPILRWVGGKTRLLSVIHEIIGKRRIRNYFESFAGGAAVFFDLHQRVERIAYLNDANIDLIETYSAIKERERMVAVQLGLLAGEDYYTIRDQFNLTRETTKPAKRASQFLALNHLCFNGLWRVNKSGHMNVPIGKLGNNQPRTLDNFPYEALSLGSAALSRATLSATPFEILATAPHTHLNRECGEGDVVFFDPPYLDLFKDYTAEGFGLRQHTILAAQAKHCARKGALVIVCGSDTDASLDIYGKPRERVSLKRTVGASKRGEVQECLWVY
jgi:DNA adenine methylase